MRKDLIFIICIALLSFCASATPIFNISFPLNNTAYNYTDVPIILNETRFENLTECKYQSTNAEFTTPLINVSCYQESALIATDCGGLDTGSYSTSGDDWNPNGFVLFDGDYTTGAYDDNSGNTDSAYLTIIYKKPIGVTKTNNIWSIKSQGAFLNWSLPEECMEYSNTDLKLEIRSRADITRSYVKCYTSTGTIERALDFTYLIIYEERMFWNIATCSNILDGQIFEYDDFFTVTLNSTNGSTASTYQVIHYDGQPPQLNIFYPSDNQAFNYRPVINFSIVEDNLTSLKWSNTSGLINYSISAYSGFIFDDNANFTSNFPSGITNLLMWATDWTGSEVSDSVSFRIRNFTSNISAYSGVQNYPPSISYAKYGFLSNVTCGAYTNNTNLSCVESTNIVNCNFLGRLNNVSVKITPYCYDDGYINGSSNTLRYKSGYTDKVEVKIYDVLNFSLITQPVTMKVISNSSELSYTVSGGAINLSNLTWGTYQLRFNVSSYVTQYFTIENTEFTYKAVSVYLLLNSSAYSTVFTIKDSDSGIVVPEALVKTYILGNTSEILIGSQLTDYTGKTTINYITDQQYKFIISKSGYSDQLLYLNPIIYSSYDILITKNSSLSGTMNFNKINVYYPSTIVYNGSTSDFSVTFSSPYGSLIAYGIRLDYPIGTAMSLGSFPYGSTLTSSITINSDDLNDFVNLTYYYTTSDGTKNFSVNIPIVYNITSGTFMGIKNNTYGLGSFERILIAVIIVIFVVGISAMLGQVLAGFTLGMVVLAYLSFIGFIPIWAIALTMISGFFLLIWRVGGY